MRPSLFNRLSERVDTLLDRLNQLESAVSPNINRIDRLRGRINNLLDRLGFDPLPEPEPPLSGFEGVSVQWNLPANYEITAGAPFINDQARSPLGIQGFRFIPERDVLITHVGAASWGTPYDRSHQPLIQIHDVNFDVITGGFMPGPVESSLTTTIGSSTYWKLPSPVVLKAGEPYFLTETVTKETRDLLAFTGDNRNTPIQDIAGGVINAATFDDWMGSVEPIGVNNTIGSVDPAWPSSWVGVMDPAIGFNPAVYVVTAGPTMGSFDS
jgi:hypothetical protein